MLDITFKTKINITVIILIGVLVNKVLSKEI